MRRQLLLATCLASTAVLLVAIASVAMAQHPTVVRNGNLILKVNGGVTPKRLSKKRMSPITLRVGAGIGTADGTQPPVARTVTIEFDKHGAINAHHLTTCRLGEIESRTTSQAKAVCHGAIIGGGGTSVRVAFPESTPFGANGPLVLFNGGVHHGVTTMYIHAYVSVPAPTAIVTVVRIKKVHHGRFGTRSIARIPQIAGGAGALTRFNLAIKRNFRYKGKKRSYLLARCANGRFFAHGTVAFDDGSRVAGNVVRSCGVKH